MDILLLLESGLKASVELGCIYGIVVLGLVISFRITGFADLTMEGSFTTGAAVVATSIGAGLNPILSLIFAMIVGAIAGLFTALLHVKVGINKLLSGIIMMTILYTVNLRIMGRPNFSILNHPSIFNSFENEILKLFFIFLVAFSAFSLILWFLKTKFGNFLRASGENRRVVKKIGVNVNIFVIVGLMISNGLIAFAGGIAAQNQGFADIGMGTGMIVIALASLLIGETVVQPKSILRLLVAAFVGAAIYQFFIALGLRFGLNPWDLKLSTGALLVIAIMLKKNLRKDHESQNIGSEAL